MISEIDLLEEDIPRFERKFGAHDSFVEVLKGHLKALQDQAKPPPQITLHQRGWGNFLKFLSQSRKER